MCSGPAAKLTLIVLNVFFVICGAALVGVGIWMQVDPTVPHYLQVVDVTASSSLINAAAWLFVVVGVLALGIAVLGCCGAYHESQCLIFCYMVLVFVLIAGEVIAASLALIYRHEAESHLESSLRTQLRTEYSREHHSATYDAWNFLQVQFKCCGATNYTDYRESKWWNETRSGRNASEDAVPRQCCKLRGGDYLHPRPAHAQQCQDDANAMATNSTQLHIQGCHENVKGWIERHSLVMIVLGFSIAALQLLGFVAACALRRQVRADTYSYRH